MDEVAKEADLSKGYNSIYSKTKDKEGVCYFRMSRLPTARSTVNGKEVVAMQDTGCTGCVIQSSLWFLRISYYGKILR